MARSQHSRKLRKIIEGELRQWLSGGLAGGFGRTVRPLAAVTVLAASGHQYTESLE
jgi:hypothetical protein